MIKLSTAAVLYEAGVPLPYIRDILGHVELATTDIYARASTEAKRKALEAAYDIVTDDLPEWSHDPDCSAGSPACEPSAARKGYAQRLTPGIAATRASGPALRITRHCS
jgi:hypothetical protein